MQDNLTLNVLEDTVYAFFKDFFDEMDLRTVHIPTKVILLTAYRKGIPFHHVFNLLEWDIYFSTNLEMHVLRNLQAEIVRHEQVLLMEKSEE